MALQAALPPTDSNEFRRSELLRRLAAAHSHAEASRPKSGSARRALAWDPAAFLGVSPYVMMGICAQVGATIGLLVFSTFQIAAQSQPTLIAAPAAIQPVEAASAPSGKFVIVAELPPPAQVVDNYYFFLRQRMFDQAWDLTDEAFRQEHYPTGFEAYQQNWAAAQAMEVLSLDVVWQDGAEAHLFGEVQEGASGVRWRYNYVLRFDPTTEVWKIHAVLPAG